MTKYEFPIYSTRWGHFDNCTLTRTSDGWVFCFHRSQTCDKRGRRLSGHRDNTPYDLYDHLNHESIAYPEDLPTLLERFHDYESNGTLTSEQVQVQLNELSEWMRVVEERCPAQFR